MSNNDTKSMMKFISVTLNDNQIKVTLDENRDPGLTTQNDKQDIPNNIENNLQSTEEDGE